MAADNPRLSQLVRAFAIAVIAVLVIGSLLLIAPSLVSARWPWPIKPFTQRFLGAFYLAEMVAIVMLAWINRWSPARLILITAACFTILVTLVSLWHIDHFNFGRRGPWGWFFVYIVSAVISALAVWQYSELPHPKRPPLPAWRTFFLFEAIFLGLYGLGLLLIPEPATAFWPWRVESFDARVYSAIFLTAALAASIASRAAAPAELAALGLGQCVIGLGAIAGLFLANAGPHSVNFGSAGTTAWVVLFLIFAGFGAGALAEAVEMRGAN
jgi:hypothetical protein